MRTYIIVVGAILMIAATTGRAESPRVIIDSLQGMVTLKSDKGDVELSNVQVEGPGFSNALEAKTIGVADWPYHLQLRQDVPEALKVGDVLLVEFWIRAINTSAESGEAKTQFVLEEKGGDYRKSIEYDASAGRDWRKFEVPFKVKATGRDGYGVGEACVSFRLGYRPQTIQIGGFRLQNYGSQVDPSTLPSTRLDYAGRDATASWRLAAKKRIEDIRMAPISIEVVDSEGNPISGAKVDLRMKKHAFGFGSAVDLVYFNEKDSDAAKYREFILDNFNQITPENDLKWDWWVWRTENRNVVMSSLRALHAAGIRIRGHTLIWPGPSRMPDSISALYNDRGALDKAISDRFQEVLTLTRDIIDEWDAVNEPYSEREILGRYGDNLVGDWFSLAHQIDPKPLLYLNDYPNFQNSGDSTAHKDDFEQRIRKLLADNIPIQGIGMQAHFGAILCPPELVVRELDRFGELGLPIQITEFDIDSMDESLKTDYTRDFLTACFSHPAVVGFTTWGFWAGKHYKPSAALVQSDWSLTPWGRAWADLVKKEWWTNGSGSTDEIGIFQIKGFLGEYEVVVTSGSQKKVQAVTLTKDSSSFKIKM